MKQAYLFLLTFCLLSSCCRTSVFDDINQRLKKPYLENFNFLSLELKKPQEGLKPEDYLGRGFDLRHYDEYREAGCRGQILKPIPVRAVSSIAEYELKTEYMKVLRSFPIQHLDLGVFGEKNIDFNYGLNRKLNALNQADITLRCRNFFFSERYTLEDKDINKYKALLSESFLEDLKRLPASELLQHYGTHLITACDFGAMQDLVLKCTSDHWGYERVFDENELMNLANAIYQGSTDANLRAKVDQNRTALRIAYYQTGSSYEPQLGRSPMTLFAQSDKATIDSKLWKEGIDPKKKNFLRLVPSSEGLCFIPNLIDDLPLKIKYLSAIAFDNNVYIDYYLCDPKTFEVIKFKDDPIFCTMGAYKDSKYCRLLYSETLYEDLAEKLGDNKKKGRVYYKSSLGADGLWTFVHQDTKLYLCRDLQYRSLQEDSEGLRFWALNPVFPRADGSASYFVHRLVQ